MVLSVCNLIVCFFSWLERLPVIACTYVNMAVYQVGIEHRVPGGGGLPSLWIRERSVHRGSGNQK